MHSLCKVRQGHPFCLLLVFFFKNPLFLGVSGFKGLLLMILFVLSQFIFTDLLQK